MALRKDVIEMIEEVPFPDVWAPLNDDLRLLAGFAPYDKLTAHDPALDLFSKSMTFTRPSNATYIDKSGVLRNAAVNEPRFEKKGLLIEGSGTNHVLYSGDATKWTTSTEGAIGVTSVGIGPDGVSQGYKLSFLSATPMQANISANIANYASFTKGGYITTSFFVKPAERSVIQILWTGGGTGVSSTYANFDLINMTMRGTCFSYEMQRIGGGWIRCTATALIDGDFSGIAAGVGGAWIGIIDSLDDGRRPLVTGVIGEGVYAWGAQVEAQKLITSYIPTSGAAATRGKEILRLTPSCNIGYKTAGETFNRTVSFEISVSGYSDPAGFSYFRMFQAYGSTYDIFLQLHLSYISSYRTNTNTSPVISTAYPFTKQIFTQTIDDKNKLTIYFNNQTGTRTGPPPDLTGEPSNIYADSTPTVVYHLRNFRIWHRVLTTNQIRGLR